MQSTDAQIAPNLVRSEADKQLSSIAKPARTTKEQLNRFARSQSKAASFMANPRLTPELTGAIDTLRTTWSHRRDKRAGVTSNLLLGSDPDSTTSGEQPGQAISIGDVDASSQEAVHSAADLVQKVVTARDLRYTPIQLNGIPITRIGVEAHQARSRRKRAALPAGDVGAQPASPTGPIQQPPQSGDLPPGQQAAAAGLPTGPAFGAPPSPGAPAGPPGAPNAPGGQPPPPGQQTDPSQQGGAPAGPPPPQPFAGDGNPPPPGSPPVPPPPPPPPSPLRHGEHLDTMTPDTKTHPLNKLLDDANQSEDKTDPEDHEEVEADDSSIGSNPLTHKVAVDGQVRWSKLAVDVQPKKPGLLRRSLPVLSAVAGIGSTYLLHRYLTSKQQQNDAEVNEGVHHAAETIKGNYAAQPSGFKSLKDTVRDQPKKSVGDFLQRQFSKPKDPNDLMQFAPPSGVGGGADYPIAPVQPKPNIAPAPWESAPPVGKKGAVDGQVRWSKRAIDPAIAGGIAGGVGGLSLASLPAIIGAATSPKGHRYEGAVRGTQRTGYGLLGAGLGGATGLGLGAATGAGIGRALGHEEAGAGIGASVGGITGGLLGMRGGDKFGQYMVGGKPSWQRNKKEVDQGDKSSRIIRRLMMGPAGVINPGVVGATDSGGDKKEHSRQVNSGSRGAIFTGIGGTLGEMGGLMASPSDHRGLGMLGGGLVGGLAGYGLHRLTDSSKPKHEKEEEDDKPVTKHAGILSGILKAPGQMMRGMKNMSKQTIVPRPAAPMAQALPTSMSHVPVGASVPSAPRAPAPAQRAFGSQPTPTAPTVGDNVAGLGTASAGLLGGGMAMKSYLGGSDQQAAAPAAGVPKRAGLMDGQPTAPRPRSYLNTNMSMTRPAAPNFSFGRGLGRGMVGGIAGMAGMGLLTAARNFLGNAGAAQAPAKINQALTGQQPTAPVR